VQGAVKLYLPAVGSFKLHEVRACIFLQLEACRFKA
jgi:hypothetical protein